MSQKILKPKANAPRDIAAPSQVIDGQSWWVVKARESRESFAAYQQSRQPVWQATAHTEKKDAFFIDKRW